MPEKPFDMPHFHGSLGMESQREIPALLRRLEPSLSNLDLDEAVDKLLCLPRQTRLRLLVSLLKSANEAAANGLSPFDGSLEKQLELELPQIDEDDRFTSPVEWEVLPFDFTLSDDLKAFLGIKPDLQG